MSTIRWTKEELDYLIDNYPSTSLVQLQKTLIGRTIKAIRERVKILSLRKYRKRFKFTSDQIEEIKKDYPTTVSADLALKYGCSLSAIHNIGHRYQLKKEPELIREISRKNMLDPDHPGRKCWIPKGNIPMNKGKKQADFMSPEGIERSKKTRFKSGDKIHNELYDQAIVLRCQKGFTYKYIRIARGKWMPLHRYNWEKEHGALAKGINICFIDGDTLNCNIENLKAVERSVVMRNNSGSLNLTNRMISYYLCGKQIELVEEYMKYPQLLDLKRKQLLINRKIKENGRISEKD